MPIQQRKAVYLVQGQKIIYSKKDSYSGSLLTNTLGVYEFEFRTDSEWTEFDKVALYLQATGVQPIYIELTDTNIATCTTGQDGNKIYTVPVPEQMLTKAGQLTVGLIGYYSNQDDFRFPTNTDSSYRIAASVQPLDGKQYPQYISIMEQILLRLYKGQGGSTEDLTELRRQVEQLNQLLVQDGDGTQFLGNDGNYHTITGSVGPAGPQGPEGPKGNDGKSAYQIAVDNGFVGTESEWIASLKGDLSDLENAVFDTSSSQNILNIISVSSLDSGISVDYTNDMLNISGAKSAEGIIEIQTDTTIEPGTYYLSTDNGNFGVANYYATTVIVDNEFNLVKRSDLVPNTGIEFSVSKTTNIKKIKITYADNRNINFSGHVWINKDAKKEYDKFGEHTQQSKIEKNTNELSKLDKKVEDINKKVIDIITPKKKTKILLSFDDARNVYTDGRYDLVRKTFGFPFTFCVSVNAENTIMAPPVEDINKMLFDGIDMGLYSSYGWDSFTDNDFNSSDETIQTKWNNYVDNAVVKLQNYGYYNPVVWLCRQNKSGTALEKAVKRNHFKMIRGINVNHEYDDTYGYIPSFDKDVSITAEMYGVYTNNLDVALTRLNNAIKNGWDISLFTHKICADASTASDVDSTVEVWTQLLTKIKEYVDAGKAECVTYSEYYRELYPVDSAELDKIRNYKMKYSN